MEENIRNFKDKLKSLDREIQDILTRNQQFEIEEDSGITIQNMNETEESLWGEEATEVNFIRFGSQRKKSVQMQEKFHLDKEFPFFDDICDYFTINHYEEIDEFYSL